MGEEVTQATVLSNHPLKIDTKGFSFSADALALTGLSAELQIGIKLKSMESARESTNHGPQELTKPTLVIENDFSSDASLFSAMLDFRPVFSAPVPEMSSDYEIVVLADCTGAMYGKMAKQQAALKLLAHSLPTGCKFNLLSVNGSNFRSQWRTSVVLDEENLQNGLWAIEHLGVDISNNRYNGRGAVSGGDPKLLAALSSVINRRDYGRNLCIFLLTAIDFSEESRQLNQLIARNSNRNMRMFCLGFGDEVDTELLNSLAFSGRGKAHYVKEDDSVDSALFQQLVSAFAPRVRDIHVTWNLDASANAKLIDQAPHRVPITASGASTTIFALFEVPVPKDIEIPKIEPVEPTEADKKVEKKDAAPADSISSATSSSSKTKLSGESSSSLHKTKAEKTDKSETRDKVPRSPSSGGVIANTITTAISSKTSEVKSPRAEKGKGKDKTDKTDKADKPEKAAPSTDSDVASVSSPRIPKSKSTPRVDKVEKSAEPPKPTHYNTLLAGLKMPITSVTIEGLGPEDQPLKWEIPIAEATFRGLSRMLTATAASKVCADYAAIAKGGDASVSEAEAKRKGIAISTQFQVISKWTSYIAVEERRGEATMDAMKQVNLTAHDTSVPDAVPRPLLPALHHPHVPIVAPPQVLPYNLYPTIPPTNNAHQLSPPAHTPNQMPPVSPPPPGRGGGGPPPPPPAPYNYDDDESAAILSSSSVGGAPAPASARASNVVPGRRNILPVKHWEAPTSAAKASHSLPSNSLTIEQAPQVLSSEARFSSEKMKRKKEKDSSSTSGALSPRNTDYGATAPATASGIARDFSSRDHLSSLGFALNVDPLDDAWIDRPFQAMMQQAPAAFRLAAPSEERRRSDSVSKKLDSKESKEREMAADESEDDEEREWQQENDAMGDSKNKPSAPLPNAARYKSSRFQEDDMVPNKESLDMVHFTDDQLNSSAKPVTLSLLRPERWDYVQETLKIDSAAGPHRGQGADQKLRVIVNTQRADGSWDVESVAHMLQIDSKSISTANPLATAHKEAEKKKKKKTKGAEVEAADAPESQSKDTKEQVDGAKAESKAEEKKLSDLDLWASVLVYAHLKKNFDAERNYWTFLSLKFQALFKRHVADEAKRKSIIKEAKAFLESLPL